MNKRLFILFTICLLLKNGANAQTVDWAIGINKWYIEERGINWLLEHYRPIYNFRPKEKVATVGAGQAIREVVFSLMADSLTFYLEDVESYWIEPDRLSMTVQAIYREAGRSNCLTTFVPVRGNEKETQLPKQFFDKIIVENSLHEFTYQAEMVQRIRENLKPNGQLFIWETTTTKPNRKHIDCGKSMFTDELLIRLLIENKFRFIGKTVVDPKRSKDAVFRFCLSDQP